MTVRPFEGAIPDLLIVFVLSLIPMGLLTIGYLTQGYGPEAAGSERALPGLTFFILGVGLLIALAALGYFLRSRRNRALAERALGG